MAKKTCAKCGQEESGFLSNSTVELMLVDGEYLCPKCLGERKKMIEESVTLTTTNSIEGHRVVEYINIGSVEVVIGTGAMSEFTGGIADIFGSRSTAFEQKIEKAKKTSLSKLKVTAYKAGGNAVIGIDLDYTEFTSNRIGVIANGTIVIIEPIQQSY